MKVHHKCTRTHITKKATAKKKKIENDGCIMEKWASGQKHTLGELGFEPCKCVHQQMICTTDA